MRISDWSSDVCSSDLERRIEQGGKAIQQASDHRWKIRGSPRGQEPLEAHRGVVVLQPELLDVAEQRGACIAVPQVEERVMVLGGDQRSEEHTSELQSLMRISYAVLCWKKKHYDI